MSETGMTRNVTMLRVFSLVMGLLVLVGWGTFVYAARTSAASQQQLQEQVAELKVSQSQLMAERDQARAGVADFKANRDQLTTERDEAKAQLIAVQQEVAALTKRLEEAQAKASETGSIRPPTPAGQPARLPAQTNRRR